MATSSAAYSSGTAETTAAQSNAKEFTRHALINLPRPPQTVSQQRRTSFRNGRIVSEHQRKSMYPT
jgi:hypothetical protein